MPAARPPARARPPPPAAIPFLFDRVCGSRSGTWQSNILRSKSSKEKRPRPATFRVTTRLDLVSPDLFAQPTAHVAHEADVVQREQREDLARVPVG